MLNAMRYGHLEPETVQKFQQLSRPVKYDDGIEPTDLLSSFGLFFFISVLMASRFPTRYEVDTCNIRRLKGLDCDLHKYEARDVPGCDINGKQIPWSIVERLVERLVSPKFVELKVRSQ